MDNPKFIQIFQFQNNLLSLFWYNDFGSSLTQFAFYLVKTVVLMCIFGRDLSRNWYSRYIAGNIALKNDLLFCSNKLLSSICQ